MHTSGYTNVDMLHPYGHLLRKGYLVREGFVTFSNNTPDRGHNMGNFVWYLIVWIPDLCLLHYFEHMYTYAKFDQNIPCGSRILFTN